MPASSNSTGEEQGVAILIYGNVKIGKTTDVAYVFRKAAWMQTERGGLIPIGRCIGYQPAPVWVLFDTTNPLEEFDSILDAEIIPRAKRGEISSLVIDTMTTFSERLINQLKGGRSQRGNKQHGLQAYGDVQDIILERVDLLRNMGIWVIMICHVKPPEYDEKSEIKLRGGPEFPGKKLTRSIPGKLDLVLFADVDRDKLMGTTERVYRCDPLDPDYIMGDRFGVTTRKQPMELAPIVWRIKNPGVPVPDGLIEKKLSVLMNENEGE